MSIVIEKENINIDMIKRTLWNEKYSILNYEW